MKVIVMRIEEKKPRMSATTLAFGYIRLPRLQRQREKSSAIANGASSLLIA